MLIRALFLSLLSLGLVAQDRPSSCASCPAWNVPQPPYRIYGNSYYVGTRGLSSVLLTSPAGHVLIDGALPESAPRIVANIHALGFRVEDIKLIVNSHAHFDHAGGIAELQKLSGARVAASPWAAEVMTKGAVLRDDPQFGVLIPIARVARVETFQNGDTLRTGQVSLTAHVTPGHTPGGTSWTWRSCENARCLDLVYADSLTPVSAKGFLFSRSQALAGFERSYAFLESAPCDILITPHPDSSSFRRPSEGSPAAAAEPVAGANACRALAARSREQLKNRLAAEKDR